MKDSVKYGILIFFKICTLPNAYDLKTESNAMMNSLVLCTNRSLDEVLELINKRNNINLSVPKITRLGYKKKIKSVETTLELEPIPEKWLAYSL